METAEPQRSSLWTDLRKAAAFLLAVGRSRSREREDTCSGRQQRRWLAVRQRRRECENLDPVTSSMKSTVRLPGFSSSCWNRTLRTSPSRTSRTALQTHSWQHTASRPDSLQTDTE